MDINESNKLIAEFTGGQFNSKGDKFTHPMVSDIFAPAEWIKYHSSWDWLMTVVEKIESLGFDSRIHGNNSDGGFVCDFIDIENNEASCEVSYLSKIDAVYSAVIEFIKWHNDLNK